MKNSNEIILSLEKYARLTPDKTAFAEAGGASVTWRELFDRTLGIAGALPPERDGRPVAVFAGRDVYTVCAIFGCIAAGRWYTLIDSELPDERIASMLDVCRPDAVISHARAVPGDAVDIAVIDPAADLAPADPECLPERAPELPMFGIFTSGSTGTPKLVVKSRRAMTSFISAYVDAFGFSPNEVFGNQIPFYFDASTKDLFATVFLGATCVLIPQKYFSFPVNLISILNEYRVGTIVWVPSALSIAARFNVFAAGMPEYLRNVLFVGEKMPVKYLKIWQKALPGARFVNLYGSTEVAGNSCYYTVPDDIPDDFTLPVGKPFPGTRVFIVDPETGMESESGEICVAGDGLAEGYFGDPEKTASVFRTVTLGDFTGRVYFSGDAGKILPDGNIVCVSRKDSQIKHMGHRIELGDIETAALSLPAVTGACCLYDAEREKIVLFFSADSDETQSVRRGLASLLPKYMIPHVFRYLPALPRNRNGKLDRARLRDEMKGTAK